MLTPIEIGDVVRRIVAAVQPREIIVFGSYAKGTATWRSDLDVLVIMDTELPMASRAGALAPVLAYSLVPIEIHIYTPAEVEAYLLEPYSFLSNVINSGKRVFRQKEPLEAQVYYDMPAPCSPSA